MSIIDKVIGCIVIYVYRYDYIYCNSLIHTKLMSTHSKNSSQLSQLIAEDLE